MSSIREIVFRSIRCDGSISTDEVRQLTAFAARQLRFVSCFESCDRAHNDHHADCPNAGTHPTMIPGPYAFDTIPSPAPTLPAPSPDPEDAIYFVYQARIDRYFAAVDYDVDVEIDAAFFELEHVPMRVKSGDIERAVVYPNAALEGRGLVAEWTTRSADAGPGQLFEYPRTAISGPR